MENNFEIVDNPVAADIEALKAGLRSSAAGVPAREYRELGIFVRDDQGRLSAGLTGATYWGWLHIKLLWVDAAKRSHGIGSNLIAAAENVARERGCRHALVDTFSFQAPGFYEKLGFRVFADVPNFPLGHTRHYLTKNLRE